LIDGGNGGSRSLDLWIMNPTAYEVNTAMQRCLAKVISLHGIGLYIYADEDLPFKDQDVLTVNPLMLKAQEVTDQFKEDDIDFFQQSFFIKEPYTIKKYKESRSSNRNTLLNRSKENELSRYKSPCSRFV